MQEETVKSCGDEHRRLRAALLVPLLLIFVAAALPATGDAQPQQVALINLRNNPGLPPLFFPLGNSVTQIEPFARSPHPANVPANVPGSFFMTTVKVNLTGFTRACFTLDYEETPVGWTLDVGNSSTADGFGGGGAGASSSVAEIQILEEIMTMFSAAQGPGVVDQLAREHLSLLDGSFKICVSKDLVTWGNPAGATDTTNSELGFQIPDLAPATSFSPAGNGNSDIFAGFNRVVSGTARNGVGLARVYITLD